MPETCMICGCQVHHNGDYAKPTIQGRSHATKHHYVAERFFGHSPNRATFTRQAIFAKCPWGLKRQTAVFCYECHEELLHNPVLTPAEIEAFRDLIAKHGLNEEVKGNTREKIAGRIQLLNKVIAAGLAAMRS